MCWTQCVANFRRKPAADGGHWLVSTISSILQGHLPESNRQCNVETPVSPTSVSGIEERFYGFKGRVDHPISDSTKAGKKLNSRVNCQVREKCCRNRTTILCQKCQLPACGQCLACICAKCDDSWNKYLLRQLAHFRPFRYISMLG